MRESVFAFICVFVCARISADMRALLYLSETRDQCQTQYRHSHTRSHGRGELVVELVCPPEPACVHRHMRVPVDIFAPMSVCMITCLLARVHACLRALVLILSGLRGRSIQEAYQYPKE